MTALLVTRHEAVSPGHYRLTLSASEIAAAARAGQFVHVLPRPNGVCDPLLRRAFSIAAIRNDQIDILYRVEGKGTSLLSRFQTGEMLDVLGPLGRPFEVNGEGEMILVGGGVGVPPLAMLAQQETLRGRTGISAMLGARGRDELLCLDDLQSYDVPVQCATDDGTAGIHGRVTVLLQERLQSNPLLPGATVYSCGPLPMLRAVAAICAQYKVACQVSMEENMPCGIGVCNGCVVEVNTGADDYGVYRRVCVDGPVIPAHEIVW